jgi:hypothetical protein
MNQTKFNNEGQQKQKSPTKSFIDESPWTNLIRLQ